MDLELKSAASLVEQMTRSWRGDRPESVRELLAQFAESFPESDLRVQQNLAVELIKIDIEERWRRLAARGCLSSAGEASGEASGEAWRLEDYLPELRRVSAGESVVLDLLVHEFRSRLRWGGRPAVKEYGDRFQELSEAVRARLHEDLALESSIHHLSLECESLDPLPFSEAAADAASEVRDSISTHLDGSINEVLGRVHPFSELPTHVLDAIALHTTLRAFAAGDVLLRQGDMADCLIVILEGAVEVTITEDGISHSIARLETDTIVGEIGLLAREKRSATVTAIRGGRAAIVPKEKFEHLVGRNPRFAIALSELIAERLGTLTVDVLWGKFIDRYQIRHRLGRGGMGVIYAALHVSSGRNVALKMLRHDLVFDRRSIRRFHQEAEIVKTLRHPNILRVFDEFSAYGTCFIAMEYCDGIPLSRLVECVCPLPEQVVRSIVGQLAAALSHAHSGGVVHRDLKPSNILVGRDGVVKLTDFGLARQCLDDASLTTSGQLLGTPMYMAPEQLLGERGDQRSDLYALGIVFYELVAGRPPFQSRRFHDLRRERLAWSIPLSNEIRPGLDPEMGAVLRMCLADDPELRSVCLKDLSKWAVSIDLQLLPQSIWESDPPSDSDSALAGRRYDDTL